MPVDKNLFLHDLAVVAILKNEGHYLKEWLDYHLVAGVNHFYLYDNESTDNQREVAAPYIKAGLVDYTIVSGKTMQMIAYNDALKRFKFFNRYMAFIDGDEFIYPKTGQSIVELVDEILSHDANAAGLSINWQTFGSNGQDKADYSRGVLERFTRRAPKNWNILPMQQKVRSQSNIHLKVINNPRRIDYISDPHFAYYFQGHYSILENGTKIPLNNLPPSINPNVCAEKIAVNHYQTKSKEEFTDKIKRGRSAALTNWLNMETFNIHDRNEEFDDGILKYRAERAKNFRPPDFAHADERLLNALMKNLSPTILPSTPQKFFAGKLETFLTCRAAAAYLQTRLTDSTPAKFFEEAALKATLRAIPAMSFADARLFMRELPSLLSLPYPAVKDLRQAALNIIPQLMEVFHLNALWREYFELEHVQDLLKLIKEE